jgi:signal transduction histidine kinase
MTDTAAVTRLEAWRQRIDRWMMRLPYAALVASTVLVPIAGADDVPQAPYAVIIPLVVLTAAWIAWWVTLHPQWEQDRRRMRIFFTGLVVLIYVLVGCSSLFGFFAWTGYIATAYALHTRRSRLTGSTLVAIATATSQAGGWAVLAHARSWPFFLLLLAFNVIVANTMTFLTTLTHEQSAKRALIIDELAQANAKLSDALKENAGLHAQLLVQAREAGMLDERQRMAGEIHDVLAQGLTGIVTQLEAADAAAARPDDWQRHLDAAKRLARDSLTEARRSVQALRPQTLDTAALPEAIGEVVTGWSKLNGVTADLVTTGTARPLLPEIETTLLRTAQEALANVARHARAARVGLTLSYMEDMVTLDVRDDGAGFDPSAPRENGYEGGYGLAAMRERLSRIAGSLEVESEPGAGTALSACVPAIILGAVA